MPAPNGSGSGGGAALEGGLASSVRQWAVEWSDVQLERLVGRGSFGRVYLVRVGGHDEGRVRGLAACHGHTPSLAVLALTHVFPPVYACRRIGFTHLWR